jgi:hypothetical protein
MEMKTIAKHKTLWKMNSTSEPLLIRGIEVSPLKKFTIPKIRRTAEKGKISMVDGVFFKITIIVLF